MYFYILLSYMYIHIHNIFLEYQLIQVTVDPWDELRYPGVNIRKTLGTSDTEGYDTKLLSVASLDQRTTGITVASSFSGYCERANLCSCYLTAPGLLTLCVGNSARIQALEIIRKRSIGYSSTPTD